MRTEDGDEIIEPGDYDLGDTGLHVYLTEDVEGQTHMWACTHCQEVDGITNALLVGVIDGQYQLSQDATGEFQISLTAAGEEAAKALIQRLGSADHDE